MQKYLIPKRELIVRDPISFTPLPEDGLLVDWNGNAGRFWRRRVKCGDVSIGEPKEKESEQFKIVEEIVEEIEPETTSSRRQKRGNK